MKLIQQTRLRFQQGNSDKVYEVDLCQVNEDEYLVNFRYGRYGKTLNEGTKTVFPVDREKAAALFEKLVSGKVKKGYVDVSKQSLQEQTEAIQSQSFEQLEGASPEQAREAHILNYLELALKGQQSQQKNSWDIKRVAWRAGELSLQSAAPQLIQLASQSQHGKGKKDLLLYCLLWAIGRCVPGTEHEAKAAEVVKEILQAPKSSDLVKRIAREALLQVADEARKQELFTTIKAEFTEEWQKAIERDNHYTLISLLRKAKSETHGLKILPALYLLSTSKLNLRKALLDVLKEIPLTAGYFKYIRQLFKAAEFRLDGQFFGLLAYRIERQAPMFKMPKGNRAVYVSYKRYDPKTELKSDNAKLAFSDKTKSYFQRRLRRTMQRLGEAGNTDYVLLATGILLQYDDAKDGRTARTSKNWRFDQKKKRWQSTVTYFENYSKELLFNQLLYQNSQRFGYSKRFNEWVCVNNYLPGEAFDEQIREEAYPELWDKMPKALIHLLIESKSEKVCDFALRNLKRHKDYKSFIARFDVSLTIKLLEKTQPSANLFGLQLARQLYNKENPNSQLVLCMLNHSNREIRQQALDWVSGNYYKFFANIDFVIGMLTHEAVQVRQWARENFNRIADLYEDAKRRALIGRLLGYCLRQVEDVAIIGELQKILFQYFKEELSMLSIDVVNELLQHKYAENRHFAAELLKNHSLEPDRIPIDSLLALIRSKEDSMQNLGLELFSKCSDIYLAKKQELLLELSTDKSPAIRQAIRPILKRLSQSFEDFGQQVLMKLLRLLLRKERYEGLHNDIYTILTEDLEQWLHIVERKLIFRLLNSKHTMAQELACVLIDRYIPFKSMTVRNIIRLADHEILAARTLAWRMFTEQIPRIKYERDEAIRLLDANWDDSREFAIDFFRKNFSDEDWTPEVLIGICDSVRTDVQAFGRELITRFFEEKDGPEYLLKLSQHPRPELQLFATNYLERFATDNLLHIQKLETFFVTVLSQVNKGRTAKDRILAFLHREAVKSYEVAEIVARIVGRISATFAKGDKATCIEIMRDLKEKYPVLEMPIEMQDFPEYSRS